MGSMLVPSTRTGWGRKMMIKGGTATKTTRSRSHELIPLRRFLGSLPPAGSIGTARPGSRPLCSSICTVFPSLQLFRRTRGRSGTDDIAQIEARNQGLTVHPVRRPGFNDLFGEPCNHHLSLVVRSPAFVFVF